MEIYEKDKLDIYIDTVKIKDIDEAVAIFENSLVPCFIEIVAKKSFCGIIGKLEAIFVPTSMNNANLKSYFSPEDPIMEIISLTNSEEYVFEGKNLAYVQAIFVKPKYLRKKYGTKMMNSLEELLLKIVQEEVILTLVASPITKPLDLYLLKEKNKEINLFYDSLGYGKMRGTMLRYKQINN